MNHLRRSILISSVLTLVFVSLGSEARAAGPQLCIRSGRGTMYAVGDGYARTDCRQGDQPYVAPARSRGIRPCIVDAIGGTTSVGACVCDEGEVAEMVGPLSVSPPGLVYDLQTTPGWDDYRSIITQVSAEQSGSITLALRCAAE